MVKLSARALAAVTNWLAARLYNFHSPNLIVTTLFSFPVF